MSKDLPITDCSSYRHRLARCTKEIDALNKAGNKALHGAYELSKDRNEIYAQIIQAEMLLAGLWIARSVDNDDLALESANYDEEFSPVLRDLLIDPEYHETYSFWDGISLRFDDGVVTLSLPQNKASEFILDHYIEVDLEILDMNRDMLAAKLEVVEKLLIDMRGKATLDVR